MSKRPRPEEEEHQPGLVVSFLDLHYDILRYMDKLGLLEAEERVALQRTCKHTAAALPGNFLPSFYTPIAHILPGDNRARQLYRRAVHTAVRERLHWLPGQAVLGLQQTITFTPAEFTVTISATWPLPRREHLRIRECGIFLKETHALTARVNDVLCSPRDWEYRLDDVTHWFTSLDALMRAVPLDLYRMDAACRLFPKLSSSQEAIIAQCIACGNATGVMGEDVLGLYL